MCVCIYMIVLLESLFFDYFIRVLTEHCVRKCINIVIKFGGLIK